MARQTRSPCFACQTKHKEEISHLERKLTRANEMIEFHVGDKEFLYEDIVRLSEEVDHLRKLIKILTKHIDTS